MNSGFDSRAVDGGTTNDMRDRIKALKSIPIARIRGFSGGNPKTHTEKDRAILDASLEAHGYVLPVAVREVGDGTYECIDGHHRIEAIAAKEPGAKLKVVVLDVADVAEGRRIILSLKHTADWDFTKLEDFVGDIMRDGASVDDVMRLSGLGGTDLDVLAEAGGALVEQMSGAPAPSEGDRKPDVPALPEDQVPEPPKNPVAKRGDVWRLGDHIVMCGDCTEVDPKTLIIGKLGFGFTSPPYNMGSSLMRRPDAKSRYNDTDDAMDSDAYAELLRASTALMLRACAVAAVNLQSVAANKRVIARWYAKFADNLVDRGIWYKGHGAPQLSKNILNSRFEDIYIFSSKPRPKRVIDTAEFHGTVSNVHEGPGAANNEYSDVHKATMPVHLAQWAIGNLGARADFVVDPFGGTGTSLIVAHALGKRAALVELSPAYVDVIVERWQKASGGKAKRSR